MEDSPLRYRRHALARSRGIGSSPSPLPSPGEPAPRKNRSKICGSSAGWIPSPVSATRSIARFASLLSPTSIDPPAGRELQRVVEQVDDQPAQMPGVAVDENVLGRVDRQLYLARLRQRSDRRRYLAQQRAQVQLLPIDHHFAVEPREHQQFVGNSAQRQASRCAAPSALRFSSGVRSRASATSSPVRNTASGVRSSCAASDANRRSVADARSSRSSKALITSVSRATSSWTCGDSQPRAQITRPNRVELSCHRLDRPQHAARQQVSAADA